MNSAVVMIHTFKFLCFVCFVCCIAFCHIHFKTMKVVKKTHHFYHSIAGESIYIVKYNEMSYLEFLYKYTLYIT